MISKKVIFINCFFVKKMHKKIVVHLPKSGAALSRKRLVNVVLPVRVFPKEHYSYVQLSVAAEWAR